MIELDSIITIQDENGNDIGDFIGFIIPIKTPYQLKVNVKGLKVGYKIIKKTKQYIITEVENGNYGLEELRREK